MRYSGRYVCGLGVGGMELISLGVKSDDLLLQNYNEDEICIKQ